MPLKLFIHDHAEQDLNRLSQHDEDGVAYLDHVIALIEEEPDLFDNLTDEKFYRDYDPPIGLLGLTVKRIGVLWEQQIRVMRIRLDDETVIPYRILYCVRHERQPNGALSRHLHILAVAHKSLDCFDYQPNHKLMCRVRNDYANIY